MGMKTGLLIGGLVLAHAVSNSLIPLVMELTVGTDIESLVILFYFMFGVCVGQLNLIALWAVFAPGSIAWRLPWAALLVVLMWSTIVIANRVVWSNTGAQEMVRMGALLGVGLLAVMIPFWLLRWALRRRLCLSNEVSAPWKQQMHLRELMLGTAFLCVALGLARAVLPPGEVDWRQLDWDELPVLSMILVVNLVTVLPGVWVVFAAKQRWGLWITLLTLGVGLATVAEAGVMGWIGNSSRSLIELLAVLSFNLGQVFSVCATLGILRWHGFRFVRLGEHLPRPPGGMVAEPVPASDNRAAVVIPSNLSVSNEP